MMQVTLKTFDVCSDPSTAIPAYAGTVVDYGPILSKRLHIVAAEPVPHL